MRRAEVVNAPDIRDPAQAAAAGKCWLSRMMGGKVGSVVADHPGTCAWCQYEPESIIESLNDFLEWAGLTNEDRFDTGDPLVRPIRWEVERFQRISREDQRSLVLQAQTMPEAPDDEPERPADLYR